MLQLHRIGVVVQLLGLAVGISVHSPFLVAWSAAFLALEAWFLTRP